MNATTTYIYIVHSDINENNIYAEFADEQAAIEYARKNAAELTYVDKVEVILDNDGDVEEELGSETIWVYSDEAVATETEDDYWDDLAAMYAEEEANKHDLGDTAWFESMDNLVETLEENEDEVECKECFDLFPKADCIKVDLGYICPTCAEGGTVSEDEIFKIDFPEYEKFSDGNAMVPEEPTIPVESSEEIPQEDPENEIIPISTPEEAVPFLVSDEEEAIAGYEKAAEIVAESDLENKEEILDTIEHIKEEEEEHIEELIELVEPEEEKVPEDSEDEEVKEETPEEEVEEIEDPETEPVEEAMSDVQRSMIDRLPKMTKDEFKTMLNSGDTVKIFYGDPREPGIRSRDYEVTLVDGVYEVTYWEETYNDDFTDSELAEEFDNIDDLWDFMVHFMEDDDFSPKYNYLTESTIDIDTSKVLKSTDVEIWKISEAEANVYTAELAKSYKDLNLSQIDDVVEEMYETASMFTFMYNKEGQPELYAWNIKLLNSLGKCEIVFEDPAYDAAVDQTLSKKNSFKEHVNDENPAIESDQELEGTDNAVVDCKAAKVVTHSEDEKPVDCGGKKKPLTEAKRDPFHEAIFEAIDYLTEFSDIFPVPGNIGAANWEELKDDINYGLSSDFEIAEIIMEYLQKDLAIGEKHPEIFEDDPQSELTLETYNRLKRAYDKAVADYEARYPEDFEEQLELKHGWDHIKSVASLVHTAVDNYTKDNRVATCENGTSFYVLGDVTTSDPEKMKKLILDTLAENGYDPDIVRYVTKGNAYGYIIDHIKAMARMTMSYQKREGLVEDVNDDVLATNKKGDYLVRNSSGRGYSVFSAHNVWQGGFECDDDEKAVSRFNHGDINESAILAAAASGIIVDVVKRIFDKFGDGKKKSKWIDFRKHVIEKTPEGQINIWNHDSEQVASDLKTIAAAKEKIKELNQKAKEDKKAAKKKKTEPKKDTDEKDVEPVTESAEDEIEPISVDPEEKPSKNVKMANTAGTSGMDFETACQKFGIELTN